MDCSLSGSSVHNLVTNLRGRKNEFTERASQVALVVRKLPANAGDGSAMGLIPGSERSPGEGNGNPL